MLRNKFTGPGKPYGESDPAKFQAIDKDGHSYYPAGPSLTAAAEAQYVKLADKNLLRDLDPQAFISELAESWGEVNAIHSFREGNTRSQFVFYPQVAEQAGYRIDAAAFAQGAPLRDAFVQARFYSQDTGRNDQLAGVLGQAIVPLTGPRLTTGAGSRSPTVGYELPDFGGHYAPDVHVGDDT